MHIFCKGEGDRAVILEAGVGAFSQDWHLCRPRLPGPTRWAAMIELAMPGVRWAADRWESFESMAERRNRLGCVAVGDCIYLIGGELELPSGKDWRRDTACYRPLARLRVLPVLA